MLTSSNYLTATTTSALFPLRILQWDSQCALVILMLMLSRQWKQSLSPDFVHGGSLWRLVKIKTWIFLLSYWKTIAAVWRLFSTVVEKLNRKCSLSSTGGAILTRKFIPLTGPFACLYWDLPVLNKKNKMYFLFVLINQFSWFFWEFTYPKYLPQVKVKYRLNIECNCIMGLSN